MWKWTQVERKWKYYPDYDFPPDETEEPKEDAEGGQALLKKEDPVAGTVGKFEHFSGTVRMPEVFQGLGSVPKEYPQTLTMIFLQSQTDLFTSIDL